MRDYKQCELEILAAVGKLIISKLDGRDDLARAIFDELYPQFRGRYPYHKALSHTVLAHIQKIDETKEEMIARAFGHARSFPDLLDDLSSLDK